MSQRKTLDSNLHEDPQAAVGVKELTLKILSRNLLIKILTSKKPVSESTSHDDGDMIMI